MWYDENGERADWKRIMRLRGGMVMRWRNAVWEGHAKQLVTGVVLAALVVAPSSVWALDGVDLVASVGMGLEIDDYDYAEFAPAFWAREDETDAGIGGKLSLGTMFYNSLELGLSLLESYAPDDDLFRLSPAVYLVQHIDINRDVGIYVGPQLGGTYYDINDKHIDDFGFSAGALVGLTWSSGIFVEYNFLWTDIDTHRRLRDVEGDLYSHLLLVGLRFEF
jgi:hypothetical protein